MPVTVRNLCATDFATIMHLEEEVFAKEGATTLGQYYVRYCCDFFSDTCFIAETDDGRAAGYLLAMLRDGKAYCTTLAICEEFRRSKVVIKLIAAFLQRIVGHVDMCWFTVEEGNASARKLHKMLGATEVGVRDDYYGLGEPRLISQIDGATFERMRPRYEKLGLLPRTEAPAPQMSSELSEAA